MYVLISAVSFLVFIIALVDIILRRGDQVKHLPKLVWVFIVIVLPFIGSVLWFAIGREYERSAVRGRVARRRDKAVPAATWQNDVSARTTTEDQLAELQREIDFYNEQARLSAEQTRQQKPGETDKVSG